MVSEVGAARLGGDETASANLDAHEWKGIHMSVG